MLARPRPAEQLQLTKSSSVPLGATKVEWGKGKVWDILIRLASVGNGTFNLDDILCKKNFAVMLS